MPLGLWGTMRALITAADMCKCSAGASPSKALSTPDLWEVSGSLSDCRSRVYTNTVFFLLEPLLLAVESWDHTEVWQGDVACPRSCCGMWRCQLQSPANPQGLVHCCQMCGAGEEAGGGEKGPWGTGCCPVEPCRMCYFLCTSTCTL